MIRFAIACLAALLATGATSSEAPAADPAPSDPPAPVCGNGVRETGEECDDGNTRNNDGCDATCHNETYTCGNGMVDPREACDEDSDDDERCSTGCPIDGFDAPRANP